MQWEDNIEKIGRANPLTVGPIVHMENKGTMTGRLNRHRKMDPFEAMGCDEKFTVRTARKTEQCLAGIFAVFDVHDN